MQQRVKRQMDMTHNLQLERLMTPTNKRTYEQMNYNRSPIHYVSCTNL